VSLTSGRLPGAHLLAAALCIGLALPLAFSVSGAEVPFAAGTLAALALVVRAGRAALLASAILLAGWWLGSLRLAALDRSELIAEIGRVSSARLVVTGPARSSPFELRVPVRVVHFGARPFNERARLDLPRGRAPPQGAIVETVAEIRRPRGPQEDGFDESSYLRRQGIHVVLSADDFRIVSRRGGLGGVADALRAFVSRGLAPGVRGERRAVIAGILLGEDEGLDRGLRDSFRASGLYHLFRKSIEVRAVSEEASSGPAAIRTSGQEANERHAFPAPRRPPGLRARKQKDAPSLTFQNPLRTPVDVLERGGQAERGVKRHLDPFELRAEIRTVNRDGRRQSGYCLPAMGAVRLRPPAPALAPAVSSPCHPGVVRDHALRLRLITSAIRC
jgi:hypothetical protein